MEYYRENSLQYTQFWRNFKHMEPTNTQTERRITVGDTQEHTIAQFPGTTQIPAAAPTGSTSPSEFFNPNAVKIKPTDSGFKLDTEAIKFDGGKADWSLVPFEALEGMVQVLEFGAKKYSSWNWTEGGGFSWVRVVSSCLRHIFAWLRGEDNDPESGLSHISHAQCNLLFLAYYIRNKNLYKKDTRRVTTNG